MSKKIPEIKVVSLTKNNFSRCITPHLDIKLVPLKNPDATLEDALGMYGIGVAAAVLMEWNAYCHWRSYGSDNPAYDNFEADIGCDLFYWAHCHSKKMISFMSTLPDYHPQSLVLDPHEKVKDLLARFPRIELNDFSLRIIAINYNPKEISMAQQTLVENMQPGKQYTINMIDQWFPMRSDSNVHVALARLCKTGRVRNESMGNGFWLVTYEI